MGLHHPVDEPEVAVRGRRRVLGFGGAARGLRRVGRCCPPRSIGCGGIGCGRGRRGHSQLRVRPDVLHRPGGTALVRATVPVDDDSHGRPGPGLDPDHLAGDRAGTGRLSGPAADADGGVVGVRFDEGDPLPERVRGERGVAVGEALQRLPRPPGVELEGVAAAAGDGGEPHPLLAGIEVVVPVGSAVQPQERVDRAAAGGARVGDVGDHIGPGRQSGHADALGCRRCGGVLLVGLMRARRLNRALPPARPRRPVSDGVAAADALDSVGWRCWRSGSSAGQPCSFVAQRLELLVGQLPEQVLDVVGVLRCPCQLVDHVELLAGVELGELGRAHDVAAFAVADPDPRVADREVDDAVRVLHRTVCDGFQPVFVVAEAAQSVDQLFARVVGPLRVAVQDVVGSAVEQSVGVLTDGPGDVDAGAFRCGRHPCGVLGDRVTPSWRRVSVGPGGLLFSLQLGEDPGVLLTLVGPGVALGGVVGLERVGVVDRPWVVDGPLQHGRGVRSRRGNRCPIACRLSCGRGRGRGRWRRCGQRAVRGLRRRGGQCAGGRRLARQGQAGAGGELA